MLLWNYFKWRRGSGSELSVMDTTQTIEYIKRNQCSVCRYGDGEFDLIRGKKGIGFQDNNRALSERLKNILVEAGKVPEILVCIPYVLTIIALIIFSGKAVGPKASGQIYDAGKR